MTLVVDASVAVRWFVRQGQSDRAQALAAAPDDLIAPDLVVPEVADALLHHVRRGDTNVETALAALDALPRLLSEIVPCTALAGAALRIAGALDCPARAGFDLALAERRGAKLVTADARLLARLSGTRYAALCAALSEFAL